MLEDLSGLARAILAAHEEEKALFASSFEVALRKGSLLEKAYRGTVAQGIKWIPWVKKNLPGITYRSTALYRQLASHKWTEQPTTLSEALQLLREPAKRAKAELASEKDKIRQQAEAAARAAQEDEDEEETPEQPSKPPSSPTNERKPDDEPQQPPEEGATPGAAPVGAPPATPAKRKAPREKARNLEPVAVVYVHPHEFARTVGCSVETAVAWLAEENNLGKIRQALYPDPAIYEEALLRAFGRTQDEQ